jgi:hypothetical protein
MRILVNPTAKPGLGSGSIAQSELSLCHQNLDNKPASASQNVTKHNYGSVLAKNLRYNLVSHYLA